MCILIYESLANSSLHPSSRLSLHSYLISHLFTTHSKEPGFSTLQTELRQLDSQSHSHSNSLCETLTRSLRDLEHCNDLIIFFNSRLTELRSDAEINLGYMDEGGILYLFLRKCLIAFAALDFDGLIRLFELLQGYKAGVETEGLPESDVKMLVSHMAESLPYLCTQYSYSDLTSQISHLPVSSRYLLQSHLDSYYHLPSAIDHLHRHFDQDLDSSLPSPSIRKSRTVISKSYTYYASLHRVKVELELGHLETAVHLLVETVKRELSEGDSAAILESSLLFCKIAGMTGNWGQEKMLSEKCILRAIEKQNAPAIILSALNCSQLDAIYPHLSSPVLHKTLTPKPLPKPKKPQILTETAYFHDDSLSTSALVKELSVHQMLDSQSFSAYSSHLLQVQIVTWLSNGNITAAVSDFSVLVKLHPKVLCSKDDSEIGCMLAREAALHSHSLTLAILEKIHTKCPVLDCINWEFTVNYISAVWAMLQGKFAAVEWLERRISVAIHGKLDKFYSFLLRKVTAERLLREEKLQESHKSLISLSSDLGSTGFQSLMIQTHLLLSEIYLQTGQTVKSLLEILKCFKGIKHSHKDFYAVYIQLAEVLMVLYPNSLKSMQILEKIRPLLREEAGERVQGRYFLCRAKCKLAVAQRSGSVEVRTAAVRDLNEALGHFQAVNAVMDARMTYYLLSRTFHTLNFPTHRDQAASVFLSLHSTLNTNSKELPTATPSLPLLSSPLHFPSIPLH